jgi:hypothetical protein
MCMTNLVERHGSTICVQCACKAAAYVLTAPLGSVQMFWNVSEATIERREIALRLAEKRVHSEEAAEISAGLATGYLQQGLLVDAMLSASLSLRFGPTAADFCWCAVDVLFHENLFRWECLPELKRRLLDPTW